MVCDHNLSGTAGKFTRLKICLEAIFLYAFFIKTFENVFMIPLISGQRHCRKKTKSMQFLPPQAACHEHGMIKWFVHFIKK